MRALPWEKSQLLVEAFSRQLNHPGRQTESIKGDNFSANRSRRVALTRIAGERAHNAISSNAAESWSRYKMET